MSEASKKNPGGISGPKKSVVDRSVVPVLPHNPDDTPSRRDSVSCSMERQHRLHGTCLIASASTLLRLNASTYATACTIFHRMYHRVSLKQYNVWSVAAASMLLATKLEDGPQQRTVRAVIITMDHLYRKRRGCYDITKTNDDCHGVMPINSLGPVWKEWYDNLLDTEHRILRELGFTLHWIPDSHPHKFLWEFVKVILDLHEGSLETKQVPTDSQNNQHHELSQRAWNYCNDSYRLDLCVRFEPEIITCAAIHLAAMDLGISLPASPQTWWELIIGSEKGIPVATVANAILGWKANEQKAAPSFRGFLMSLEPAGSFNDPDSFLWESRG